MNKRIISIVLCLIMILALMPVSVFAHTCVDADGDYWCDDCGWVIYHQHYDPDTDGWCNKCSCWIDHDHVDYDGDHKCDLCSNYININIYVTAYSQPNKIADHVQLYFYPKEPDSFVYTITGNPAQYTINYTAKSFFQLIVSKYGHVPQTFNYNTNVEDIYINVTLYRYGDINKDGKINVGDAAKIYGHVRGSGTMTDDYSLEAADVSVDGKVNIGDVAKVYAHAKGSSLLF